MLLDVGGVAYELDVPMSTFYALPANGEAVTLHTHLLVREDAHSLYGFATLEERSAFRQLIRISGVGARTALAVLSGMSVGDLAQCVALQDAARLVKIPGIGKKTAERLLLELRGKLAALPAGESAQPGSDVLRANQLVIDRWDRVLPDLRLGDPRSEVARERTHVAMVPPEHRRPGNISAALARLDDFPEFAPAIGLADLDGAIDRRLAELTELFARIFLANAHNGLTAIVFIHGVTSLCALGHIAPRGLPARVRRGVRPRRLRSPLHRLRAREGQLLRRAARHGRTRQRDSRARTPRPLPRRRGRNRRAPRARSARGRRGRRYVQRGLRRHTRQAARRTQKDSGGRK